MNGVDEKQYVTIELHDAQLERLEALIERNLARQEAIAANMRADIAAVRGDLKADITELKSELKADIAEVKGDVKELHAEIKGVEKTLNAKIDGVMDAVALTNTRIDDLQTKQSNSLTKWGIIIAVTVGVVQVITAVVLHFIKF